MVNKEFISYCKIKLNCIKMVTICLYRQLILPKHHYTYQRNYRSLSFSKIRQIKNISNQNVIFKSVKKNNCKLHKHLNSSIFQNGNVNVNTRFMSSFPSFSTNDYKGIYEYLNFLRKNFIYKSHQNYQILIISIFHHIRICSNSNI